MSVAYSLTQRNSKVRALRRTRCRWSLLEPPVEYAAADATLEAELPLTSALKRISVESPAPNAAWKPRRCAEEVITSNRMPENGLQGEGRLPLPSKVGRRTSKQS